MKDNGERDNDPKVVNASIPEWAKFAASIIGAVVVTIAWAESRFVARVEWAAHQAQQALDMAEIKESQRSYALAEKGTATNLGAFDARLSRIETKIDLLLDPPKRRP